MTFRFGTAAGAAAILSLPNLVAAQTLTQRDVSLRMALTIAETASQECGANTSVAVVDRAGRLRVFLQGDNANPHNIELAPQSLHGAHLSPAILGVGQAHRNRESGAVHAGRRDSSRWRDADQHR
jgi:hypothetical protein